MVDKPTGLCSIRLLAIGALAALAVEPGHFVLTFWMGSLVGFSISGTQAIIYSLAPSCYPTAVRGAGVGFAVAVGRVGSALGPLFAGALLGGGASPARVLAALAPVMIVSGLAALIVSTRLGRVSAQAGRAVALNTAHDAGAIRCHRQTKPSAPGARSSRGSLAEREPAAFRAGGATSAALGTEK